MRFLPVLDAFEQLAAVLPGRPGSIFELFGFAGRHLVAGEAVGARPDEDTLGEEANHEQDEERLCPRKLSDPCSHSRFKIDERA